MIPARGAEGLPTVDRANLDFADRGPRFLRGAADRGPRSLQGTADSGSVDRALCGVPWTADRGDRDLVET